jgi:histidine triad (HIT) family protein
MPDCLFCNIVEGKVPSNKVFEDDRTYAFEDIHPQAPTHVLVIPKKHISGLQNAEASDAELIGHCYLVAARIAHERGIEDTLRAVCNVGPRAGQSVFHLHIHVLGGRDMQWPPG